MDCYVSSHVQEEQTKRMTRSSLQKTPVKDPSQGSYSLMTFAPPPPPIALLLNPLKSQGTDIFLCQLTCQSAGIMSSLCGVGVGVRVRVNNFSSKTTRPRDVLFFLKDTLSIEDEKLFKACKSVCSSVC